MPTETELQPQQKDATPAIDNRDLMIVAPVGLEQTDVQRYLKLSFNLELPSEKIIFHALHLGYPDPVGQLRTHARIWGYNYKINGENAVNPATGQLMSYVVWQKLDPPVMPIEVTDPPLESDVDPESEEFNVEPLTAAT
jgi:hypothetical protein